MDSKQIDLTKTKKDFANAQTHTPIDRERFDTQLYIINQVYPNRLELTQAETAVAIHHSPDYVRKTFHTKTAGKGISTASVCLYLMGYPV